MFHFIELVSLLSNTIHHTSNKSMIQMLTLTITMTIYQLLCLPSLH